jgi:dihydropteroate synthase
VVAGLPSNPIPRAAPAWRCRELSFDLSARVLVMGVLNVTPDSFSDGGRHLDPRVAIEHGRRLIAEGADMLDIGAESTRPGAVPVPAEEQWRRLEPVLPALAAEICVSVDTASAAVAERALDAGARVVNDVTALGDSAMAVAVARSGAGLVLMHMQGSPADMQLDPRYDDVAAEVSGWLAARVRHAVAAGIARESIAVDPGIGFGKTLEHNLELIARLGACVVIGRPVLVGVSRKSFLGRLLDRTVDERLEGGLAAAAIAVFEGASIVRTHDVAPTVRAVRVAHALRSARVVLAPPSAPAP